MSRLAEIEQSAEVLPVDQKQRLIATLQAGLPERDTSSTSGGTSDQAVHASLLPLAATSWSQDWDSAEEDEAWLDLSPVTWSSSLFHSPISPTAKSGGSGSRHIYA